MTMTMTMTMTKEKIHLEQQRDLYEQSKGKTLFFTTSASSNLKLTDGKALTGLYRCTLDTPEDLFDDFTHYGEDEEICNAATKVGDGNNFDGATHEELVLRNLQFDLSSLREDSVHHTDASKKSYLYANTHKTQYLKGEDSDWEIVRAQLPDAGDFDNDVVNSDGSLTFESVFKTRALVDWNECEFNCCSKADYERLGFLTNAKEFDTNYEYRHTYTKTMVRSFVVDEHTGDIFVSWEGYYKDCQDIFSSGKKLLWTLGISRLKMEDPTCVLLDPAQANDQFSHSSNFPRCTEPVSIVYQSTRGREAVLPYGGLAVIPESQTGSRRTFLLSVLYSPGIDSGELTSRVWAFPEGADSIKDGLKRQDLTGTGTVIDGAHFDANVWDGGSLRLNYNSQTQKPDYLCRTVYEAGIECIPIGISTDNEGLPVVMATSKTKDIFLTEDQLKNFCRLNIADKAYAREFTLVTGLDVQWDPVTGEPHRVFFGCWGGEKGTGNFGSVQKDGHRLKQVMENAYADAVLFLPSELEVTAGNSATGRVATDSADTSRSPMQNPLSSQPFIVVCLLSILCLGLATIYKRRKQRQRFSSSNVRQQETGFRTPYVELQSIHNNTAPLASTTAIVSSTSTSSTPTPTSLV